VISDGVFLDLAPIIVTSGVPQERVLGPKFFILYIIDIAICFTNSTIRLFAEGSVWSICPFLIQITIIKYL